MLTPDSKKDIIAILLVMVAKLIPTVLTHSTTEEESTPHAQILGIAMLVLLGLLAVLLVLA